MDSKWINVPEIECADCTRDIINIIDNSEEKDLIFNEFINNHKNKYFYDVITFLSCGNKKLITSHIPKEILEVLES